MIYPRCENYSKMYSSISSINKHEKKKIYWSENNINPDISFNEQTKLFHCQTAGCTTIAKYRYNIVKHLMLLCQQELKKSS